MPYLRLPAGKTFFANGPSRTSFKRSRTKAFLRASGCPGQPLFLISQKSGGPICDFYNFFGTEKTHRSLVGAKGVNPLPTFSLT
jgi:hypothetical protein